MKYNKGFVGLGVVIAIILGFLVVGGGGYYLINKEKVAEQNIEIEETTEINTELENTKEELIVKEVIDIKNKVVKLLAPNGDTTFNEGEKMKILWQGGGDSTMQIYLYQVDGVITYDSVGNLYVNNELSFPKVSIEENIKNTGEYDWITREDLPTGKYMIRIMCNFCASDSLDFSDAPFVINSNIQTNWETLSKAELKKIVDGNSYLEKRAEIWYSESIDLTGDGVSEGIFASDGGNNNIYYILGKDKNGVISVLQNKEKNGQVGGVSLIAVGRVSVNEGYQFLPAEQGFYTSSLSIDLNVDNSISSHFICTKNSINAYKWNATTKLFEWNQAMTTKYTAKVCN